MQPKKSQLHFYTLTTNYLKKLKKAIPFIIVSKTIKHLGINLTKEMKDLYTENYKTLRKETLGNTQINRKISHVLGLKELKL